MSLSTALILYNCFASNLFMRMQPFDFVVGEPVSSVGVKKINDVANGLFSGQSGVKPPPALSTAVIGMKPGGKVCADQEPMTCCLDPPQSLY